MGVEYQPSDFPKEGLCRSKAAARFLGIGNSTFLQFVRQGRIQRAIKLTERTSVWQCEYIRSLVGQPLPPRGHCHVDEMAATEKKKLAKQGS